MYTRRHFLFIPLALAAGNAAGQEHEPSALDRCP